jgi:hypothetical protein
MFRITLADENTVNLTSSHCRENNMKLLVAVSLVATLRAANASAQVAATSPAPAPAPLRAALTGDVIDVLTDGAAPAPPTPLRARLTNDVIKQAVQQTLAADKKETTREQGTVLGTERYENFSRKFSEAKVPDCLHPDGLKNQPTFFLAGLLAVPFVAVAAIRGVCR